MDYLDKLHNIDWERSTPDDVRKCMDGLHFLGIPFNIHEKVYILRGRRGSGYTEPSQMKYCPVEKCSSIQRASLIGHTMFYGVIADNQSHLENARAIVASECSKLCREGIESVGREIFTVAHWLVEKPLHVISFINDTIFPEVKNNLLMNQLRNAFQNSYGELRLSEEEKTVTRFISSEFCKYVQNEKEYLISATITNDITNDCGCDGVVYPSVQLGGQGGINIALTPQAVDEKLRLIRTIEQTLYKNKDQSFLRLEKANGKELPRKQIPDSYIEKELGINNLFDLPIV